MIELRHPSGQVRERIPGRLIDEVISALPENEDLRVHLIGWRNTPRDLHLDPEELHRIERQLAAFAHDSPTRLGTVGRLPDNAAGRIVEGNPAEGIMMSVTLVLSLALRRILLLHGIGDAVWVAPANAESHE